MRSVLLLTCVMLAVAMATSMEQPLNTIMAQINTQPFGQAISAMVQMQMDTEAPSGRVGEISKLLVQIQALIDTQNTSAKTAIETKRATCDEQKGTYQKQIDQATSNQADNKQELKDLSDEQNAKKNDLLQEKANKESTRNDLDTANNDLAGENTFYQQHHASFEEAIIACEEAIRLLNQIVVKGLTAPSKPTGLMFVQLSQKFEGVKDLLEKHLKKTPNAFIQPIIDVLMELGSEASIDLTKVNQIIGLIKTLLQRLREGLRDREISHQTTLTDLNSLIEHLKAALNTSTSNVEILEQRLAEIQARKAQLEKLVASIDDVLALSTTTLKAIKDDCAASEGRYASEQSKRESELATLKKLIDYFQSQVVTTTSHVNDVN